MDQRYYDGLIDEVKISDAALSPSEFLNAVMESMDVQAVLGARALNSMFIREGLKIVLLNHLGLYEKLRERAAG